jgi:SpoVK/Ycf46/Vps4 family AAA+-type ATPase
MTCSLARCVRDDSVSAHRVVATSNASLLSLATSHIVVNARHLFQLVHSPDTTTTNGPVFRSSKRNLASLLLRSADSISVRFLPLSPTQCAALALTSVLLLHDDVGDSSSLPCTDLLPIGSVVARGDCLAHPRRVRVLHSAPWTVGIVADFTVISFHRPRDLAPSLSVSPPRSLSPPTTSTPLRFALPAPLVHLSPAGFNASPSLSLRVSLAVLPASAELASRSDALLDVDSMARLALLDGDSIDVGGRSLRVFLDDDDDQAPRRRLQVGADVCFTLLGERLRTADEPLLVDISRRSRLDDGQSHAVARSLSISMIASAQIPLNVDCSDAIRAHFERAPLRSLQLGDTFAVDASVPLLLPDAAQAMLALQQPTSSKPPRAPEARRVGASQAAYEPAHLAERAVRVYFRVSAIDPVPPSGAPVVVDPQRTRVTQTPTCASRCALPPLAEPPIDVPPSLGAHVDVVRALLRDVMGGVAESLASGVLFHGGATHVRQSTRLIVEHASHALSCRVNVLAYAARDVGVAPLTTKADSTEAPVLRQVAAFVEHAAQFAPCVLVLDDVERLIEAASPSASASAVGAVLRTCGARGVLLVASTAECASVAPGVRCAFAFERRVEVPSEQQRTRSLAAALAARGWSGDVDARYVATQTAGCGEGELSALLDDAQQVASARAAAAVVGLLGAHIAAVTMADVDAALERWRGRQARAIGAPRVPKVRWDDVGGLERAKRELLDVVRLPLERPELFASGVRQRSGVLMYGPPGVGKTLLAKAVATECGLAFLSVKGPELLNMYVGESERNVRAVFDKAREAAPCVIFFDELDALAPNRGGGGGVMDRVVAQLLAELDGMQSNNQLFVIGATNRPDLLDAALLRPGRFDRLVYLGVPATRDEQCRILRAITRKFTIANDCDFPKLLLAAPMHLTGADFYALCADAFLAAVAELVGGENDTRKQNNDDDDDDDDDDADDEISDDDDERRQRQQLVAIIDSH